MSEQPSLQFSAYRFPKFEKTIGTAVSGDVRMTELEVCIIDTRAFQRLKRIRQLGAAHLIYPTAMHTRFDHSLGVLAMADRMVHAVNESIAYYVDDETTAQLLRIDDLQRVLVRLYALLHDITHIPFGHTLEDEMGLFPRHDNDLARFEHYLGTETDIGKLIQKHLPPGSYQRFRDIYLRGERSVLPRHDEVLYHLVSDTVCADLLDYIMRDSFFCNLDVEFKYRFLDFLHLADKDGRADGENQKLRRPLIRLWKKRSERPRGDTLNDLVRLLEARYMIAERVYFHHAKLAASTMIARAVQEAHRNGSLTFDHLYAMGDDGLVDFLADGKHDAVTKRLAVRYRDRCLYKKVKTYSRREIRAEFIGKDHSAPIKASVDALSNPEQRLEVESKIERLIGADHPGQVLIYAPKDKDGNLKLAKVHVRWQGEVKELWEVDDPELQLRLEALGAAHKQLSTIYLFADPSLGDRLEHVDAAFEITTLLLGENHARRQRDESHKIVQAHMHRMRLADREYPASLQKKAEEEVVASLVGANFRSVAGEATIEEIVRSVLTTLRNKKI